MSEEFMIFMIVWALIFISAFLFGVYLGLNRNRKGTFPWAWKKMQKGFEVRPIGETSKLFRHRISEKGYLQTLRVKQPNPEFLIWENAFVSNDHFKTEWEVVK